jgi:hypothetical protein
MRHFLETLQDRDAAARDWRHLLELTGLAFSTVRATTASAWVEPS